MSADHGTTSGYDRHMRDGSTPCADCRAAAAEYEYRRRIDGLLGRTRTEHSDGTARRVRALVALGYTFGQIGGALGRSQDWAAKLAHRSDSIVRTSTAERVDALYRDWCMRKPDESTGKKKWAASYARSTARKHGWVPPLAWDDIDRDDAPAVGGVDDQVDPVVVARILAHDASLARGATLAERRAVVAAWPDSLAHLERLTGWRADRYINRENGAA